ncbi:MAG: DUF5076 domain-containing protein [Sphingomonadaceae bacterium]|nr:DUF5076 domain-containing protein [Sphingomonadaceae bacterium]
MNVTGIGVLKGTREFARLWAVSDGPSIALISPSALSSDPFVFGMSLADAARHGAKAYAQAVGISEEEAMVRIWAGLDAERAHPTDAPTQISGKAN